jgi:hypothetical protein
LIGKGPGIFNLHFVLDTFFLNHFDPVCLATPTRWLAVYIFKYMSPIGHLAWTGRKQKYKIDKKADTTSIAKTTSDTAKYVV